MSAAPGSRAAEKRAAAERAVALVADGMVVGLGSGSTAECAIEALAARMKGGLRCVGIPSSERSAALAERLGIPLAGFADHPVIDLTLDGADEVELASRGLVKGLGGALLREKILAAASRALVIMVDDTKLVGRLGERAPIPVEVVPFGWEATARRLEGLGAQVARRLGPGGAPFVSDGGHAILDCRFGPLADPAATARALDLMVGVVEHGLFLEFAPSLVIASGEGVRLIGPG